MNIYYPIIHIHITSEIIAAAKPRADNNPVALAIKKALDLPEWSPVSVVPGGLIWIKGRACIADKIYKCVPALTPFLEDFHNGKKVVPFSFELCLHDEDIEILGGTHRRHQSAEDKAWVERMLLELSKDRRTSLRSKD